MESQKSPPRCKFCRSRKTVYAGNYKTVNKEGKRVKCKSCNRIFMYVKESSSDE